jgi:signal transduction histidine kinase
MVADALDDPSLELAFRIGGSGRFVDSRGKPTDPTAVRPGRSATAVERKGQTVAFIIHDDGLDQDPELVRVAGLTMQLALENGRLGTHLASTIEELRASRARTVSAGDAERRRIERDLHDGAQQHLVALRVQVGLASELAETDPELARARMSEFGEELEEILDELRRLAHGIYPSLLVDYGLVDALAAVAGRASPPATVEADGVGRYPHDIEAAVYFCCLEGLQNVGKHAGLDARAAMRVREDEGHLSFEVSDDGAGYDAERVRGEGNGLTNMSDRIGALGGTLTVQSTPGAGTTVRGSVPLTRP